jgi:hypothetical protein
VIKESERGLIKGETFAATSAWDKMRRRQREGEYCWLFCGCMLLNIKEK